MFCTFVVKKIKIMKSVNKQPQSEQEEQKNISQQLNSNTKDKLLIESHLQLNNSKILNNNNINSASQQHHQFTQLQMTNKRNKMITNKSIVTVKASRIIEEFHNYSQINNNNSCINYNRNTNIIYNNINNNSIKTNNNHNNGYLTSSSDELKEDNIDVNDNDHDDDYVVHDEDEEEKEIDDKNDIVVCGEDVDEDVNEDANETPEHHARRPMNAFLVFCKRHRAIVRAKYPTHENR